MSQIHSFAPPGLIDVLLEKHELKSLERDFENCVEEMRRKCDAQIASKLVRMWFRRHSYIIHEYDTGNIQIVAGIDAAGLGRDESEQYLKTNYWDKYFEEANHSEKFWNDLFEEGKYNYRNAEVSNLIPDDPIQRFVLHFLRGWQRKLNIYMLDEEIPEEERILVLKKQVANFAFFSRMKSFGSLWKLESEPNDYLQQALQDEGMLVPVHDSDGKQARGIQGEQVHSQADKNSSRSAADGPKPDDQDRKMYDYIKRYAARSLGHSEVHDSWTMVKGSFSYNSKMIKCYAFSGHSESKKELHKMPLKWWEENSGEEAWEDGQKMCFADVDHLQFGQYLLSALFNAQRSFIEDDFKKLTQHIAFDERSKAESVITGSRRDMTVLDYGLFYDCVVSCLNKYDKKIKGATTNVLKVLCGDDTSSVVDCVWPLVSVGCKNKKFAPEKDKLESLLGSYCNDDKAKKICDRLCKMSEKHLQELEKELNTIPKNFLRNFEKHLQQSRCGEDNVIDLLLQELLKLKDCDCYLWINVKFVALDANHQDGKPFCEVCARKVRFYSALPQLLRAIGSTGEDFDRFAPLFAKLK